MSPPLPPRLRHTLLCWRDGRWRWQRQGSQQAVSLVIGQLDGVHRGHQALLRRAAEYGFPVAVLTFEPPPRDFFQRHTSDTTQGNGAPVRISNLRSKLAWLLATGVHQVHVLRFNPTLANLSPEAFVTACLQNLCAAKHVVVGSDFRYGRRRQGDTSSLKTDAAQLGISVDVVSDIVDHDMGGELKGSMKDAALPIHRPRIASTGIRALLQAGQLQQAQTLLGHPVVYTGRVLHGKQLGRTLGYPTLNLRPFRCHRNHQGEWHHPRSALTGVLLVKVRGLPDIAQAWGIASLGHRPTVNASHDALLEVFVLDWHGNAYGKLVEIEVVAWRRHEQHFVSLEDLKQAMAADLDWARDWIRLH